MAHEVINICMRCSKCEVRWWIKKDRIAMLEFIQWQDKAMTDVHCPACGHGDDLEFDLAINYRVE